MPFGLRHDVLRPTGSPNADRVTYVELFFDLVYVFALTQLSAYLYRHQDLLGLLEGVIMVVALWWSWLATTWVTNWLDPAKLPVRGFVIGLSFLALVMSVSIADSFGDRAWVFTVAYVTMQLGRTTYIVFATWRHDRVVASDFVCVLAWTAVGSALWIAGALLPLSVQLPLWALALGVELLGTLLGFRVPGLGRVNLALWDLSVAHIAERSALFVLIAIGEGLLVVGFAFVGIQPTLSSVIAMALAFVNAAALWWIYFDRTDNIESHAPAVSAPQGRLVRIVDTYAHLLVIGGVVIVSVGDKEILGHPTEHSLSAAVSVIAGPLLFLAGVVVSRRILDRRAIAPRLGLIGMVAVAVVAPLLAPLAVGALSAAVLIAVAAIETRDRLRPGHSIAT
jgi:low temperature requirement protein LtrA